MSKLRIVLIALISLFSLFIVYFFLPIFQPIPQHGGNDLRVAVWMGVTWSMDVYDSASIAQLADDLQRQNVDDIYVYVSYLKAGDFFNPTYDHASVFVEALREFAPDLRIMAWVGVPITITQPDGQRILNRLETDTIRQQIADFSIFVINELGFDGFHLNAELIPNNDRAFIETLELIQTNLPDNAIFSTTAHALRLGEQVTASPYPVIPHHWSREYLLEVGGYVDQIAVMTYDSGLVVPRDYQSWMTYQVASIAQSLDDTQTEVLVGIPTSEEWTPSHQTQAETLKAALQGFHAGYESRINGIAIYPYWDTSSDEWDVIADFLNE